MKKYATLKIIIVQRRNSEKLTVSVPRKTTGDIFLETDLAFLSPETHKAKSLPFLSNILITKI